MLGIFQLLDPTANAHLYGGFSNTTVPLLVAGLELLGHLKDQTRLCIVLPRWHAQSIPVTINMRSA
jgi:hypothetical protein